MFQRYILENRSVATTQQDYKHKKAPKNQSAIFAAFSHYCTKKPLWSFYAKKDILRI